MLLRRYNTGYQDGAYTLPAGHIDTHELPIESAIRELYEETGLTVDAKDMQHIHTMDRISDSGRTYVDVYFEVSRYTGQPAIMEPDKCDNIVWADSDNLPNNTLPNVLHALEQIRKHNTFSELRQQ